jgi:hypothetical protein
MKHLVLLKLLLDYSVSLRRQLLLAQPLITKLKVGIVLHSEHLDKYSYMLDPLVMLPPPLLVEFLSKRKLQLQLRLHEQLSNTKKSLGLFY